MADAPAGWYPVEDGRQRYWDGLAWTGHFHPPGSRPVIRDAGAAVIGRLMDTSQHHDPEALWQSVGRPITGIGAGRYRLTAHYLFFERGALRTDSQQVPISAVVDVDVRQSMTQKARGLFSVLVHVQRSLGVEVVSMEDIPDGREAQRIINETAHAARLTAHRHQNTHRHENTHLVGHVGVDPSIPTAGVSEFMGVAPAPAALQPAPAADPIEQLRRLGELRDAGVLTSGEFESKKAEILGRL